MVEGVLVQLGLLCCPRISLPGLILLGGLDCKYIRRIALFTLIIIGKIGVISTLIEHIGVIYLMSLHWFFTNKSYDLASPIRTLIKIHLLCNSFKITSFPSAANSQYT